MSELTQIVLTSAFTILGGVIIFSITRIVETLYIAPVKSINRLRGEISYSLTFYANRFGSTDIIDNEMIKEASNDLRSLGSKLRSQVYLIKNYRILEKLSLIEPKTNLLDASSELIGLSNSIYRSDFKVIDNRKEEIKTKLNILD